jgi:hypothetical protein
VRPLVARALPLSEGHPTPLAEVVRRQQYEAYEHRIEHITKEKLVHQVTSVSIRRRRPARNVTLSGCAENLGLKAGDAERSSALQAS